MAAFLVLFMAREVLAQAASQSIQILNSGLNTVGVPNEIAMELTHNPGNSLKPKPDCDEFKRQLRQVPMQTCIKSGNPGACKVVLKLVDEKRYGDLTIEEPAASARQIFQVSSEQRLSSEQSKQIEKALKAKGIPSYRIMPTFSLLVRNESLKNGSIEYSSDSITVELSKIPGFKVYEPEYDTQSPVIRTLGRDMACDLLEGRAIIKASAELEVRTLPNEAGLKGDMYWSAYQKLSAGAPIKAISRESQLAGIGARIGREIDLIKPALDDADFEKMVVDLFPMFFEVQSLKVRTYKDNSRFNDVVSPFLFVTNADVQLSLQKAQP